MISSIPGKYGELFDGPVLSLAKISVAQMFDWEHRKMLEKIANEEEDISDCNLETDFFGQLEMIAGEVERFRQIKEYDDGFLEEMIMDDCSVSQHTSTQGKLSISNLYNLHINYGHPNLLGPCW